MVNSVKVLSRVSHYFSMERNLRALLATSVIMTLGSGLWSSLLGLYITDDLGVQILTFGLMGTVRQLVSSLAIFPSGLLSDNFGRKKMIMLSTIFSISTLTTLLFVKDLPWLFLVPLFQGLGMAFMAPSRSAFVIDVTPDERRGAAFATLALFQSLSSIIATSLAGVVAGVFGFHRVFGVALALESFCLFLTMFCLKESLDKSVVEKRPTRESMLGQFRSGLVMLKNPPLLAVLLGVVFHQLGLGIQGPYLTIYASNVLMFSLPAISLMLGLQRLGIFLGHFPSGRIVDKYSGEISFAFHIFATSPLVILFTITGTPIFASLILFTWGLTFGLDNVSRQKLIARYKSESGTATAFGVISLIAGVVSLVTPAIGGWVWTSFSPKIVFYTSAATNIFGSAPLFILWLYHREQKPLKDPLPYDDDISQQ